MPLLQFHVLEGRSDQELAALLDAAHRAVLDTFHVPERDRYQIVHEHKPSRVRFEDTGLGIKRSDKFVLVHISTQRHPIEQKTAFYDKLCAELERSCGIKSTDVMVSIVENTVADWSFGLGRAQFLTGELHGALGDAASTPPGSKQPAGPASASRGRSTCALFNSEINSPQQKLRAAVAQTSSNNKETIMTITTRLTKRFGIKHPIVLAPMTPASGGALASAVAAAGGLGLLGGGYVDRVWFEAESAKVTRSDVGAGFITWTIPEDPGLLDIALERHPRAMMLSFSDPGPYATRIKKAGVPLICQVHTLDHAFHAVDVGADVVVAQGTEAGGHGWALRSTMPFVPSVVDALAARAPEVLVLAAGGIADGRGLAASLMLGADGVLMGTRFWATQEALIPDAAKARVLAATGDETIRTSVYDLVRGRIWPPGYTGRLMRNDFIERWQGREKELAQVHGEELRKVEEAEKSDDFETANVTVGETIGLVHDIPKAGALVDRIVAEASDRLMKFAPALAA